MMRLIKCLIVLILSGCLGGNPPDISELQLLAPRPFGYVIGDEIQHRIVFHSQHGAALQTAELPKQGEINRWLTLNQIDLKQTPAGSGFYYQIDLTYQVFYAPQEVKMLIIPGLNLTLKRGDKRIDLKTPAWHFTMSPLRELAVRKDDEGDYRRPDIASPLLSNALPFWGLLLAGGLALLSALYLSFWYGYLGWLYRPLVFKLALRQLAAVKDGDMAASLSIVHNAFNKLYQKPLFAYQLDDFFQQYPAFKPLKQQLTWFFEYSNRFFFIGDRMVDASARQQLQKICISCRQIERSQI
ncbi:MAG: nonribosomal peptide synthetase MxaA [Methylococcaceae bacterium]|jgi:mxaA protein